MGARIEVVEVLSFRLRVPQRALERLPGELETELELRLVSSEDGSLLLAQDTEECYLRFRPTGDDAELIEIAIANDAGGTFFQAVLGALMVRFGGDLRVRLVFDPSGSEVGEPWAEVFIEKGRTTYPGLATQAAAANLSQAATEGGSVGPDEAEAADEGPLSPEEEELARLLRKAQDSWQEYQRLKRERQAS